MSKRSKHHRAGQARRNGALSHGPVSPQGKATSSLNAVSHALCASKPLVLQDENAAAYNELRHAYHLKFQPADPVEADLVDLLVHSIWQLRRCQTAEIALLNLEIDRLLPETRQSCPTLDPAAALALAVKSLADNSRSLDLLRRYQSAHERTFRRTLDTLLKLRAAAAPTPRADTLEMPETVPTADPQPIPVQPDTENYGTNPEAPAETLPEPPAVPPIAATPAHPPGRLLSFPSAPAIAPSDPVSTLQSDRKGDPR